MNPAEQATLDAHRRTSAGLDFSDDADFADARRGFIATVPDGEVRAADGRVVFSQKRYAFVDAPEAPPTVHPSLWRHARLNRHHGLFQVSERIFQVRGLDLANVTFIEGDEGLIVIDAATYAEAARCALELFWQHRPRRPIHTMIYSHSHIDHYGGVRGLIDEADVRAGRVQVIAPDGFLAASVDENILAGVPMRRRAMFQFGPTLPPGPQQHVDSGLGIAAGRGTASLIAPTRLITRQQERLRIDGVEIVFQLTPQTEAPAEMNFFFPDDRALNLAENACQTMHNLCPIRGAKTRDALGWSKYLDEALREFVPHCDVAYAQHHWPVWGTDRVAAFVADQRDMYRYLHDQTLRLMSHGYTPHEIADALMMPNALSKRWNTRGYYGAVAHNVRSIYTHYLGHYDGNPATLDPLTPVDAGRRYVQYMGGAAALMAKARADYARGDYRWVVQVTNHLVFADPGNTEARALCADAMEQLGYQAEAATWRNAYLLGAHELRNGAPKPPPGASPAVNMEVASILPLDMFLDFLAIRVDGLAAQDLAGRFDWRITDEDACRAISLGNGVLNHAPGSHGTAAEAVVSTTRAELTAMLRRGATLLGEFDEGRLQVSGDRAKFRAFLATLDQFAAMFNIVEP